MTPFAGALLATGSGSLVVEKNKEGRYYLEWFSNEVFLFDPPSAANLAVVANTAWTAETGDRYARTYYAPPRARYVFLSKGTRTVPFAKPSHALRLQHMAHTLVATAPPDSIGRAIIHTNSVTICVCKRIFLL